MKRVWIWIVTVFFGSVFGGQGPPRLNPFLFTRELSEGMRARVLCTAYDGALPIQFHWTKDGQALVVGTTGLSIQQLDSFTSVLTLDPLQAQHSGNYSCLASNGFGSDSYTDRLLVKVPPRWRVEPSDVRVAVGSPVQLLCQADGSPVPEVKWYRSTGGTSQDINSTSHWQTFPNGSLVIKNAAKSDAGYLSCEVGNGVGKNLKKTIDIEVYAAPQVDEKSVSKHTERGKAITLPCNAKGDMPLSVVWLKDGSLLSSEKEFLQRSSTEESLGDGALQAELTIRQVTRKDAGLYTCIVKNEFGQATKAINVVILEKPEQPPKVEVSQVWSRHARIDWTPPYSGHSTIRNYILEYWIPNDRNYGNVKDKNVTGSATSAMLDGLLPATAYNAKIWAENSVGPGSPSSTITFRTGEEEPSEAPIDVRVTDAGNSFITLAWQPPLKRSWHGHLIGYYVGYRLAGSRDPYSFHSVSHNNGTQSLTLRGLERGSSYEVVVQAYNAAGSGQLSDSIIVKTREGESPPKPTLMVISVGPHRAELKWSTGKTKASLVSGYRLFIRRNEGSWQEISMLQPSESSYILNTLDNNVIYQAYVVAHGPFGNSEPSDTVSVTAPDRVAEPAAPRDTTPVEEQYADTLHLIVPITVSVVIIVIVITAGCVFVYVKKPHPIETVPVPVPYFVPPVTPKERRLPPHPCSVTLSRRPPVPVPPLMPSVTDTAKKGEFISPYATVRMYDSGSGSDDEAIYDTVMDEIKSVLNQRTKQEEKSVDGVII